ncbi:MAG: hypothetical protein AAF799_07360 [Myxococcota bacterium]
MPPELFGEWTGGGLETVPEPAGRVPVLPCNAGATPVAGGTPPSPGLVPGSGVAEGSGGGGGDAGGGWSSGSGLGRRG